MAYVYRVTLLIGMMMLPTLIGAAAEPIVSKQTPKERCDNDYIFVQDGKTTDKPRGNLPYAEDEYRQLLAEFQRMYPNANRHNADALARSEVQKGIAAGKICDGKTVCGSVFYQNDLSGSPRDYIVCPNKCDIENCNKRLRYFKGDIMRAWEQKSTGKPLDFISTSLPAWATQSTANRDEAVRMLERFYNGPSVELGEGSRVEALGRREVPANPTLSSYTAYEGIQSLSSADSNQPSEPPPLRITPGIIPGAVSDSQRITPRVDPNEGYVGPLSSLQNRRDVYVPTLSTFTAPTGASFDPQPARVNPMQRIVNFFGGLWNTIL